MNSGLEDPRPLSSACSRCGAAFHCGVTSGSCWCATVPIDAERSALLKERYRGCLCERCLRDKDTAGP
ncbi:MAG: cysteine-rich CWC family protein [Actinomycetota bacterium]